MVMNIELTITNFPPLYHGFFVNLSILNSSELNNESSVNGITQETYHSIIDSKILSAYF